MAEVRVIHFTQDQMRTLTGVSVEKMRHWRSVVPYLANKTGKSARFSFGDVVGIAVVNEVVETFGVMVKSIRDGVDALFQALAATSFGDLELAVVRLTADGAELLPPGAGALHTTPEHPTLAIALAPIVLRLQDQMLPAGTAPRQPSLPYPPEAVRTRA